LLQCITRELKFGDLHPSVQPQIRPGCTRKQTPVEVARKQTPVEVARKQQPVQQPSSACA